MGFGCHPNSYFIGSGLILRKDGPLSFILLSLTHGEYERKSGLSKVSVVSRVSEVKVVSGVSKVSAVSGMSSMIKRNEQPKRGRILARILNCC